MGMEMDISVVVIVRINDFLILKKCKHRELCLVNYEGSTNVSSYLFPILSNGNSYFILYIKPDPRRREVSGYVCSTNCLVGKKKLR